MSTSPLYPANADFASATTIVTSTVELKAALMSLSQGNGGTILLDGTAGPYFIQAQNLGLENAGVLITPLDENEQPHVYQVDIHNSSNITIHGMKIDSREIDETRDSWDYDVNIYDSKSIEIVNNDFQSDGVEIRTESNGAVQGERAVIMRNSEDVSITHNTIVDYSAAIVYLEVKGLDISHNNISGIQGDGLAGGGIQDVTISHNYMHDFHGSTQTLNHSDMIQIWGTNAVLETRNIEISHNLLDAGDGAATQSILIQNESFTKNGIYFQDFSIHNNVIHNGMAQGIGTRYVEGLEVYDNTVLWNEASTYLVRDGDEPGTSFPRLILRHSPDADVYGNIVGESILNDVLIEHDSKNYILDYTDNDSGQFAASHFVNLSGQGDLSLQDIALLPDSPLYGNFGATLSSLTMVELSDLGMLRGDYSDAFAIEMSALEGTKKGVELKIFSDFSMNRFSTLDNVTGTWSFSDGQTKTGMEIKHVFAESGQHSVTLTLEVDGEVIGAHTRLFYAQPSLLFSVDFESGLVDESTYSSSLRLHESELQTSVGRNGSAFELDGASRLHVDRKNTQFSNLDTFELQIGYNPHFDAGGGVIAMLHKAWSLKITDSGTLEFFLTTSDGHFSVHSEHPIVDIGQWHDIEVMYDGTAQNLQLLVNGDTVGVSHATGSTTATTGFDIVLGAYWEKSAIGYIDHFAMLTPTSSIYQLEEPDHIAESIDTEVATTDQTNNETIEGSLETLLDFRFGDTLEDRSTFSSSIELRTKSDSVQDTVAEGRSGAAFNLNGANKILVERENNQFGSLDYFEIEIGFRSDLDQTSGSMAMRHRVFNLDLEEDGSLTFTLRTNDGIFVLTTDAGAIQAHHWHDLIVKYDSNLALVTLIVDGRQIGEAYASGTTTDKDDFDIVLGSQWGLSAVATIDQFKISTNPRSVGQVELSDRDLEQFEFNSSSEVLLNLRFEDNVIDVSGHETEIFVKESPADALVRDEVPLHPGVFVLDGHDKILIDRAGSHLAGLDAFQFNIGYQMENTRDSGTLAMQHKVFKLEVDSSGHIIFELTTSAGKFQVRSEFPVLFDTQWHEIKVDFDNNATELNLIVDGNIVGSTYASGSTSAKPGFDIVLGDLWDVSIQGKINHFSIETETDASQDVLDTFEFLSTPNQEPSILTVETTEEMSVMFGDFGAGEHVGLSDIPVESLEDLPVFSDHVVL